jgi:chorismate mutase
LVELKQRRHLLKKDTLLTVISKVMKKRLEADLMSIAHRVLQIKDKSDVTLLCNETRKLYEKLAILQFVEEHFGGSKPTIGQAEIVEKMKHFFEENHLSTSNSLPLKEPIVEEKVVEVVVIEAPLEEVPEVELEEVEEEIISDSLEESEEIGFIPAFELDQEQEEEEEKESPIKEEVQISFMDLLGGDYSETMFVKLDQSEVIPPEIAFDIPKEEAIHDEENRLLAKIELNPKDIEPKKVSLNEKISTGINIDLNDRIAFVKNLFGNSEEDYNRVLNQLITYDSFEEAHDFIEDMVKPDYNNWEGKEDYSQRFMTIIEKKFA